MPRATYRLQLNAAFDFAAAARAAPYLARLGVSHLYSSPILQAAPGSSHGYDVVDPRRVSAELGGRAGWAALRRTLGQVRLGVVLDIVPNHLAISADNPWWWDVLANGRASRYAPVFDVEWRPPEPALRDTILMPILADQYGRELEAGRIHVEREGAHFLITYHDHRLPLAPASLEQLLAHAARRADSDELRVMADLFASLRGRGDSAQDWAALEREERRRSVLGEWLERLLHEQPDVSRAVDEVVAEVNHDPDRLDALLEMQHYRLAYWRAARRDLGYRRFFDITTLAGVRVEDENVFGVTHQLVLGWLDEGAIDGLRVDHPDGLRDPAGYFARLRMAAPRAWLVAEKIVEPDEEPPPWAIDGTTGYEFLRRVDALFVDPAGERALTSAYADFTGHSETFAAVVRAAKLLVLDESLGSELNRLADLGLRVVEGDRRYRDHTRHDVHEALREICVSFDIYRTYVRAEASDVSADDIRAVSKAVERAHELRPDLPVDLLEFLRDVLLLRIGDDLGGELAMRFQQLTGAVMAKGVEDTAFYRYNRLISLNEVGGDPGVFGISVDEFHRANADVQRDWPAAMLTTSTHDTKRAEDVRARLHLLSQLPEAWRAAVARWTAHNERHRRDDLPDRNTEWYLYQTLVGAWPIELERVQAAMLKSVREQKVETSWARPDERYERALARFIESIYGDAEFCDELDGFVDRLEWPGRLNSLSLTLLRLTSPGVPDVYQGTELWDNSLVDPDNRRPVDFALRERLLAEVEAATPEAVLARCAEGLPKLWVIQRALRVRAEHRRAFGSAGDYQPLAVSGAKHDHAVAFARGGIAATVAPRLTLALDGDWADTMVELPAGEWRNALTDETKINGGGVPLARLLARFPVALLVRSR